MICVMGIYISIEIVEVRLCHNDNIMLIGPITHKSCLTLHDLRKQVKIQDLTAGQPCLLRMQ